MSMPLEIVATLTVRIRMDKLTDLDQTISDFRAQDGNAVQRARQNSCQQHLE